MTKNYKFVLQENMYDCGVAALKTIFLQYGKKIKSSDVVRKTTSQGTTAYELISSSKKLGLNAKGVRTTLDALTIKHLPCIAHIIKDKNYFHYIVIFEKNNKNKTVTVQPKKDKSIKLSHMKNLMKKRLISLSYLMIKTCKKKKIKDLKM